jgi:hypothetical protein
MVWSSKDSQRSARWGDSGGSLAPASNPTNPNQFLQQIHLNPPPNQYQTTPHPPPPPRNPQFQPRLLRRSLPEAGQIQPTQDNGGQVDRLQKEARCSGEEDDGDGIELPAPDARTSATSSSSFRSSRSGMFKTTQQLFSRGKPAQSFVEVARGRCPDPLSWVSVARQRSKVRFATAPTVLIFRSDLPPDAVGRLGRSDVVGLSLKPTKPPSIKLVSSLRKRNLSRRTE